MFARRVPKFLASFVSSECSKLSLMPSDLLKVILLGDAAVGKTSIRNRYLYGCFSHTYRTTIGADFITKDLVIDGRRVVLQIWDTAGQERFQSLGTYYYRGADACILCYDVNSMATFDHLARWREEFLLQSGVPDAASFPFLLLGNKTDVDARQRQVTPRQARDFALRNCNPDVWRRNFLGWAPPSPSSHSSSPPSSPFLSPGSSASGGNPLEAERDHLPWFETSAKDGANVEATFDFIARRVPIPRFSFEIDTLSITSRRSSGRTGRRRVGQWSCCAR